MTRADPAELFRRHRSAVHGYLAHLTGRRETAADLTQEVFLRVVRGFPAYRERGRARAWILRIARNVVLDHRRAAARGVGEEPLDEERDPTPAGGGADLRLDLRRALATLAELDREVLLLRELSGLSYAEIAELCGLSHAAVRSRIFRARMELRGRLGPKAGAEPPTDSGGSP